MITRLEKGKNGEKEERKKINTKRKIQEKGEKSKNGKEIGKERKNEKKKQERTTEKK